MYAVVRHFSFKPEYGPLIAKLTAEGLVAIITQDKGFVRYYWLDLGNGEGTSFGVFKD